MIEGPGSIVKVLRAVSDDKSITLFKTIARETEGIDAIFLRDQTKFTRKQYYSRIEKMQKSGLIKKRRGRYFLTSFGKVINETLRIAEKGLENYWKLKAMDSLITSSNLANREERKALDTLLDNDELKRIVRSE